MKKALVTGVAGFIGSHLCRELLHRGYSVRGVDCFLENYPRSYKEEHLSDLRERMEFVEGDLLNLDLASLLEDVEVVVHLAAQPGVRASWGAQFSLYSRNNLDATQRLLEAAKDRDLEKFVFASTSSVYGDTEDLPLREGASETRPVSPYGVTKLACEHLVRLYFKYYALPAVTLRYFTVFGPGQRPDMAFHKFFRAMKEGLPVPVFGDGRQTRDFTYVSDIVAGTLAAVEVGPPGEIFNLGGGFRKELEEVLRMMEEVSGLTMKRQYQDAQRGDMRHTYADISKAQDLLGYAPSTSLKDGIKAEWEWFCGRIS